MRINYLTFKNDAETISNRFIKSIQGIDKFNRWVIGNLMSNAIEICIVSVMLYNLVAPKYFINTLVTYIVYMYVTKKLSLRRSKIIRAKFDAETNSENKIFDIVYNIETVKYFQCEEKESQNYSEKVKGVRQKDEKVMSTLAELNSTQGIILALGMISNLTMGIYDCYNGVLTPGDLVMLQTIYTQIMIPLNFVGTILRDADESRVKLQYAVGMMEESEKERGNKPMFEFKGGRVEFENVGLNFYSGVDNKEKVVLKDMNAVFEKNTMNAIVGFSGQGKTTVFNLIYKFYDPVSGRIVVDGQDIKDVDEDSYRNVNYLLGFFFNFFNKIFTSSILLYAHKMDICSMSRFYTIYHTEIETQRSMMFIESHLRLIY